MAQTYLSRVVNTPTPQNEALPGQVENSAGGYSFPVDDMTRLRRFLILGSEGGSYYANERELTLENVNAIRNLIADGRESEVVSEIVAMRDNNRAPKLSPLLFALAVVASEGSPEGRRLAFSNLNFVAKTASQLFEFVEYADSMRRWGRGFRSAVTNWYTAKSAHQLAYQVVKYRNRHNWTHRDLLRKAHPHGGVGMLNEIFRYVTTGEIAEAPHDFAIIRAYEEAKTANVDRLVELIQEHNLTWEMVPSESLSETKVWRALSEDMPLTALLRNLATLTRVGVIKPMECGNIVQQLGKIGHNTGIHPLSVLNAMLTYQNGRSVRGSNTWTPVPQIVDALEDAFDRSFADAPQTNKRIYLALDVSGSMGWGEVAGVPGLTPRMASAAMAMAIARREPNYYISAFSDGGYRAYRSVGYGFSRNNTSDDFDMAEIKINAKMSLPSAINQVDNLPFGGTDCSLPMRDALKKNMGVDCFVILTDSETWAGPIHPAEALRKYRQKMGIPAKLVVVGMVSNGFSIADPNDAGMMDVVGFDTAVPQLMADFMSN